MEREAVGGDDSGAVLVGKKWPCGLVCGVEALGAEVLEDDQDCGECGRGHSWTGSREDDGIRYATRAAVHGRTGLVDTQKKFER